MKLYCLGCCPDSSCFLLKIKSVTILLDCGLELITMLPFITAQPAEKREGEPPNKKQKISKENNNLFTQIGSFTFINDSNIKFGLPNFSLCDISAVDVIVISNYHNILSLPYLTEYCGFKGKIYATEPTIRMGKLLMSELVQYVNRCSNQSECRNVDGPASWQNEQFLGGLPREFLRKFPNPSSWKNLYFMHDVDASVAKIRSCSYYEELKVTDAVSLIPISSGYCIGSSNWIIKTPYEKISYVSRSSINHRYSMPLDTKSIEGSDVIILADVSDNQHNAEAQLNELCNHVGLTLNNGGNVLMPCISTGISFELFDYLITYLNNIGLHHIPIFFVSPVSDAVLAYSNILGEWLSKNKQEKIYLPEAPFAHANHVRSGKLKQFKNTIDGKFGLIFQEPCIVICGHPSLRCGDVTNMLENWKNNPRNALICTDSEYDLSTALKIYEPHYIQVYYTPIDWRLSVNDVEKLLRQWQPTNLFINKKFISTGSSLANLKGTYAYKNGDILSVSLKRKYEKGYILPHLAEQVVPISVGSRSVAHITATLSLNDGIYTMDTSLGRMKNNETNEKKYLWGAPNWKKVYNSLSQLEGVKEIEIVESENRSVCFKVRNPFEADIYLSLTETKYAQMILS